MSATVQSFGIAVDVIVAMVDLAGIDAPGLAQRGDPIIVACFIPDRQDCRLGCNGDPQRMSMNAVKTCLPAATPREGMPPADRSAFQAVIGLSFVRNNFDAQSFSLGRFG
jgi:hypothetical protein